MESHLHILWRFGARSARRSWFSQEGGEGALILLLRALRRSIYPASPFYCHSYKTKVPAGGPAARCHNTLHRKLRQGHPTYIVQFTECWLTLQICLSIELSRDCHVMRVS